MQVIRLDEKKFQQAYNIMCKALLPDHESPTRPPFGMTFCEIEPNGRTSPHDHYDGETFLILSGKGSMRILSESQNVGEGDLIIIPNHSNHDLSNSSSTTPLQFLSVYWDEPTYGRKIEGEYLIYAAPPTPNGKLHVGHLSGPYMAADVLRRYLKLRQVQVNYCCGVDENQTYVPAKAKQLGRPLEPLKVSQEFTETIRKILTQFSAMPDFFLEPHKSADYKSYVQMFFSVLVKNGQVQKRVQGYPFCESCQIFVHESQVSGGCPHCKATTNGNGCEACGLYNDCRDLISPQCNHCASKCVLKLSERYVFVLDAHREWLSLNLKQKALPSRFKKYAETLLAKGLQEVTVTYPCSWGIPVPPFSDQVGEPDMIIYEWLEMAAGYLFAASETHSAKGFELSWIEPKNKTVLAFGFDNSFFYMGLVPALLKSFDERIKYPDSFMVNFFYLLEGKKFSTSRNHAVWGDEILSHVSADSLRFFLSKYRPEEIETNFTLPAFNSFLAVSKDQWDDLFLQIQNLPKDTCESIVLSAQQKLLVEGWNLQIHEAELALSPDQFSLNRWSEIIFNFRKRLDSYVEEKTQNSDKLDRVILTGLRGLAQLLAPVLPSYAESVFRSLGAPLKWTCYLDMPTLENFDASKLPQGYFETEQKRLSKWL